MSDLLPHDPWSHPSPMWDHVERGALLQRQLSELPPAASFYAVLATLDRADLFDLVLFNWLTELAPDWRRYADGERSSAE